MRREGLIVCCIFSNAACSEYGFSPSKISNEGLTTDENFTEEESLTEEQPEVIDDIITAPSDTGVDEDISEDSSEDIEEVPQEDLAEDTGIALCGESLDDDCDFDGWSISAGDCNDDDPLVYPYAGDIWGDGVDSDCDTFDCESGWHDDTYYALCGKDMSGAEVKNTWEGSELFCQSAGYDGLARLDTPEENNFALTLVHSVEDLDDVWIGLSDDDDDGTWLWTDGTTAWTNFGPGEPSATEENCVELYAVNDWTWNDRPCNELFPAICQHRSAD